MAVKASASITLSFMVDIKATYRYYKLQASTASAPSAPTAYPPSSSSGWDDAEPRYTSGSTNTLYFVDCTVLTNNSFTYSKVSVSSSYEAAKEAYNKAQNAQNTADSANSKIDNLEIGGRNLARNTSSDFMTSPYKGFNGKKNICPSLAKVYTTNLRAGDVITCRLVYKYENIVPADGKTAVCWIQGSGNVTEWGKGSFDSSRRLVLNGSGEHIFEYRITISEAHLRNAFWSTNIRHDYVQSGSVNWKCFKVEKGNKATDWTPAPEDVDEKIDDAAKVATNYIDFTEGTGLVVGDMTSETLGNNVLIDSDSVDIRNGTTVNASFGASKIELGKNSDAASIKLINNRMTINVARESSGNNYWANIVSKHLTLSPIERDDFFDTTIPKGGWPPYIYIKRIDKQVTVDNVSGTLYTGTVYVGCQQAYIRLDKNARGNSSYDSTGKITMHGSAIHVEGSNAIDFKTDDTMLTKNSDYRIYGGRVIYSNSSGSTGTITLLETAANFSFLEIHYGNINYQLTTRVFDPNNKKVPLFFDYMVNSTTHHILTKKVTISKTSITTDTSHSGYGNIIDGGTIYVGTENSVKIYYVIGFK